MSLEPKPGLVIRFDFLWKTDQDLGLEHGRKDRPCAIVLLSKLHKDDSRTVVLCPITHSPPMERETGIELPPKVARHLELDDEAAWIKTHQVNTVRWRRDQIPLGVTKAREASWALGMLPYSLAKRVFDEVAKNSKNKELAFIRRERGSELP